MHVAQLTLIRAHCARMLNWLVIRRHLIGQLWSRESHSVRQNGVEMTCDGKLELHLVINVHFFDGESVCSSRIQVSQSVEHLKS